MDVARAHSPGVKRQDHFIDLADAPLPFTTICGSNADFRSRGTVIGTDPDVVVSIFP